MNPGWLFVARKINGFRVLWHESLQPAGQPGFLKHEVLHETENGCAQRVVLRLAFDRSDFRYASTADPLCTFDHRYVATYALQIICSDQTVNACANDQDVWILHDS